MPKATPRKQRLEAPIIFGTDMVRALLERSRKTQTRRIAKDTDSPPTIPCRFDVDTLWVREAWCESHSDREQKCYYYRATPEFDSCGRTTIDFNPTWKSPIFMPRRACRIAIKVESVTSQLLQDITPADAIAEGIELAWEGTGFASHLEFMTAHLANPQIQLQWKIYRKDTSRIFDRTYSLIASYRSLWESINGSGAWEENPRAWVIKFQPIF